MNNLLEYTMENFEQKFIESPENAEIRKEEGELTEGLKEEWDKKDNILGKYDEADKEGKEYSKERDVDPYSPEAIMKDIEIKAEKISSWAKENSLVEGEDYLIIKNITDIEDQTESIAPHEYKQFFVLVHENHYEEFTKYITGPYSEERKKENPNNKYGGPKLDYSWGGRYAVICDGVFFDTVAVSDFEKGIIPTHHEEFKTFFRKEAGFDFPTSKELNPILREISKEGLEIYQLALEKMKDLRDKEDLPDDGYGLIDAIEHAIMILEDAKNGEAVIDLSESLSIGEMPAKMRHYADITYNAEDIKNFDRVEEITGISIPEEARIDKIFEQKYNFDRQLMENICKGFSNYIMAKKRLADNKQ